MNKPALPSETDPLLAVWAECLAQVLAQISGSPQPAAVLAEAPAGLPAASAGDLWMVCQSNGGLRGEMSFRIPPASAAHLARVFMSEPLEASPAVSPEDGPEISPEQREAGAELMRQVAGLVASALKPRWGEVQLRLDGAPGPPSWAASVTFWLRLGEDPATAPVLELHLSAALAAALRAETPDARKPASAESGTPAPLPPSSPGENKVKLDLLLEVELGLILRFGSRSLPLRDILNLKPGAVIDLDRQVQEPVDVLLDGRLVARGEVVVMEGNYGLRVTEVAPAAGV